MNISSGLSEIVSGSCVLIMLQSRCCLVLSPVAAEKGTFE